MDKKGNEYFDETNKLIKSKLKTCELLFIC